MFRSLFSPTPWSCHSDVDAEMQTPEVFEQVGNVNPPLRGINVNENKLKQAAFTHRRSDEQLPNLQTQKTKYPDIHIDKWLTRRKHTMNKENRSILWTPWFLFYFFHLFLLLHASNSKYKMLRFKTVVCSIRRSVHLNIQVKTERQWSDSTQKLPEETLNVHWYPIGEHTISNQCTQQRGEMEIDYPVGT